MTLASKPGQCLELPVTLGFDHISTLINTDVGHYMNPLETIILALGSNVILLTVLGFLARSLFSQYLAKDLKQFETNLTQRTQLAAEELRHQLGMAAHEHHVRFSKLHERQAQIIEDVYARILDFEDASAALALANNDTPENLLEFSLRRAEDSRSELAQYIRQHEILLPEDTIAQLHTILNRVNRLLSACSYNLMDKKLADVVEGGGYFPEHKEAWSAVHQYLDHEAPLVRKSLESEFRKRLGAAPQ